MHHALELSLQSQAWAAGGFNPLSLFGPSDNGFYFDFSKTDRTFQEANGPTLADDATEPVGLALSGRLWGGKTFAEVMAAQPELADTGTQSLVLATGSISNGGWNITTTSVSTSGVRQAGTWVQGKYYQVGVEWSGNDEGRTLRIAIAGTATVSVGSAASGAATSIIQAGASGNVDFYAAGGSIGDTRYMKIVSVKEVPGNHAIQSVSTSYRPTRQAGGILRWDGVDDYLLTSSLPSAAISMFIKGVCGISRVFMGSRTGNSDDIELLIAASGGIGANAADTFAIGTNNIRGVTGTYGLTLDASYLRVWEGSLLAAETAASGTINTTVPIMIGARNTSGTGTLFLTGDIHKALVINRALTQAEIASLVNAWS